MGSIYVRAKVKTGRASARTVQFEVDGGSATSVIGLNTACRLSPDLVSKAKEVRRETVGGATLVGLQLPPTSIATGRYKATLNDIFIPIVEEVVLQRKNRRTGRVITKTIRREVDRDEPPLLGQDFLQATGAVANHAEHKLDGVRDGLYDPPASLSRKFRQRPATQQDSALIRSLASCAVTRRSRR
jgi:hypothetical protein